MPATNLASNSVAKLLAKPAAMVEAPTPARARTMSGRLPSRSDSKPVNGAPSAHGSDMAAASSPAWPSGTPSSRERSTSSGATIVMAVTKPRMDAVIRNKGDRAAPADQSVRDAGVT